MDETKTHLRRRMLALRDLVSPQEAREAAAAIAQHGVRLAKDTIPPGGIVAFYWPIRSEIDTRMLADGLAKAGFLTALPVMHGARKPLVFRQWQPDSPLVKGALGLSEPTADAPEVIPNLVFVPLSVFDGNGHRLGYGGANYDATLHQLRGRGRTIAAGLAFARQEADLVPTEAHDQRLDYVLTEAGLFPIRSGSA